MEKNIHNQDEDIHNNLQKQKNHSISSLFANQTIQQLLNNVKLSQVTKILAKKAEKEMQKEFMKAQENICLQLCPNVKKHAFLYLQQDNAITTTVKQPIRPMSATCNKIIIKRQSRTSINNKNNSRKIRRYASARITSLDINNKHRNKQSFVSVFSYNSKKENQKYHNTIFKQKGLQKCIKITCNDEEEQQPQIQQYRILKQKQQLETRKRNNFLQTIQTDNKTFQKTQIKFISQLGKKDITYSYKGQVVQLKKRKAGKIKQYNTSRIQFQDQTQKKDRPFTAKTINISYKPPQGKKRQNTRQTQILECQDCTQKNFKTTQHTQFLVIR